MNNTTTSPTSQAEDFADKCLDSLVDPLTGEIIEQQAESFDTSVLEKYGYALRAISKRMEHSKLSMNNQIAIAKEIYNAGIEKLQQQYEYLLTQSRVLMECNDMNDYKGGAGKFRWQKQQPTVSTDRFDTLTPEAQEELYRKFPHLFTVKVSPNKKAIKDEAKQDGDIGDFKMMTRESKFVFAEDK